MAGCVAVFRETNFSSCKVTGTLAIIFEGNYNAATFYVSGAFMTVLNNTCGVIFSLGYPYPECYEYLVINENAVGDGIFVTGNLPTTTLTLRRSLFSGNKWGDGQTQYLVRTPSGSVAIYIIECQFETELVISGAVVPVVEYQENQIGYKHGLTIMSTFERNCWLLTATQGAVIDEGVIQDGICTSEIEVTTGGQRYTKDDAGTGTCLVVRKCLFQSHNGQATNGGAIRYVVVSPASGYIVDSQFLNCETAVTNYGGGFYITVDRLLVERCCGRNCVAVRGTFAYCGSNGAFSEFYENSLWKCGTKERFFGTGGGTIYLVEGPFQLVNTNFTSCSQDTLSAILEQEEEYVGQDIIFSGWLTCLNCSGSYGFGLFYKIGMRFDSCLFRACTSKGWLTQKKGFRMYLRNCQFKYMDGPLALILVAADGKFSFMGCQFSDGSVFPEVVENTVQTHLIGWIESVWNKGYAITLTEKNGCGYLVTSASATFSPLEGFADSSHMTKSSELPRSADFSMTNSFSSTAGCSITSAVSISQTITQSETISISNPFQSTSLFSETDALNQTQYFSPTELFSHSNSVTGSDTVSNSLAFSFSSALMDTETFSATMVFSETNPFSITETIKSTQLLSNSYVLTASNALPLSDQIGISNFFNKTVVLSVTNKFPETESITKTESVPGTSRISISSVLDSTQHFSGTDVLSLSSTNPDAPVTALSDSAQTVINTIMSSDASTESELFSYIEPSSEDVVVNKSPSKFSSEGESPTAEINTAELNTAGAEQEESSEESIVLLVISVVLCVGFVVLMISLIYKEEKRFNPKEVPKAK
jgi:hypothetical protein